MPPMNLVNFILGMKASAQVEADTAWQRYVETLDTLNTPEPQGTSMSDAPRITDEHIDSLFQRVVLMRIPDTTVTICVITLENGFNLVGHSACVSPENFDQQIGEDIAYRNAREKAWELEGYLLSEKLHREAEVDEATEAFTEAAADLEFALDRRIA